MSMPMEMLQKGQFSDFQTQQRQQHQQVFRDPRIRNMTNPAVPGLATTINLPGFINYKQFNSNKKRNGYSCADRRVFKKNKTYQVNRYPGSQAGKWQQPYLQQRLPADTLEYQYQHHHQHQHHHQEQQSSNENYQSALPTTKTNNSPANSPGVTNKFNSSQQQFNGYHYNPVSITDTSIPPPSLPGAMNGFNVSRQQLDNHKNNHQLLATKSATTFSSPSLPGSTNEFNGSHIPIASSIFVQLNLDVSAMYQDLFNSGVTQLFNNNTDKPNIEVKKEPKVIELSYDKPETLKIKHPELVAALHNGRPCGNCGIRFLPNSSETYGQHLDWHFRESQREKAAAKQMNSRAWYCNVNDWLQPGEIADEEACTSSFFERQEKERQEKEKADNLAKIISAPFINAICSVCRDPFEDSWMHEKEEWHSLEAVSFDGQNYHPTCLDDHKRHISKESK